MNEEVEKLFREYAQLKTTLAEIEKRRAEIELKLLEEWSGESHVETNFGKFHFMSRRTYKYSTQVDRIKELLSKTKKEEEQNGTALLEADRQYIRFELNK